MAYADDAQPSERPQTARLKPKQAAFIREYTKDFNATQAAIRAGYSPASARQQASRLLLTNADIQRELAALLQQVEAESVLSLQEVLERDSELATCDPAEVFAPDASCGLRAWEEIPAHLRRCISSVRRGRRGAYSISFLNPHPSLERLARFHGTLAPSRESRSEPLNEHQDDRAKARTAADWLERVGRRLGTDSVSEIVAALRGP